jgi:hypothetical protein
MRYGTPKFYSKAKEFVSEGGYPKSYLPTHWMPLPKPPTDR